MTEEELLNIYKLVLAYIATGISIGVITGLTLGGFEEDDEYNPMAVVWGWLAGALWPLALPVTAILVVTWVAKLAGRFFSKIR